MYIPAVIWCILMTMQDVATSTQSKKMLITGANGQLGKALREIFPHAEFVSRDQLDITDPSLVSTRHWQDYETIINAAAYTAVDAAETAQGRKDAWNANACAVANLSKIAIEYNLILINISSDYVFDGSIASHDEDEAFTPLSVYGQTKAAGDAIVSIVPRHYTVRTEWVVGEGNNFVRTMESLAARDIKPTVVSDQIGRLTFTDDLAKGIKHLLDTNAPYGTYNLSNDGQPASWADIAKKVYVLVGKLATDITPVTTEEYYKGKEGIAPRPLQSTLTLDKIKATGFTPKDWERALEEYLK